MSASNNEELAQVHTKHKEHDQIEPTAGTYNIHTCLPSMVVAQVSGIETTAQRYEEKCKQRVPDEKRERPTEAGVTRRRSSVKNFRGSRHHKEYVPVWYQRASLTSSDWFDGSTHYNKNFDSSNQVGAFAPNVNVEEMVKKEKKIRGIKETEPYSDEDQKKSLKRNIITLNDPKQKQSEEIHVYHRHPDGEISPSANPPHQSNEIGHHAHKTNVFYQIQPRHTKSRVHYQLPEVQPAPSHHPHLPQVPFGFGKEMQLYYVNDSKQKDQNRTPRKQDQNNHSSKTVDTSSHQTATDNSSVTSKSGTYSPSNTPSSGTATKSKDKTSHHSGKHHNSDNSKTPHHQSVRVGIGHHSEKNQSPDNAKTSHHSGKHQSPDNAKTSHHSGKNQSPDNAKTSHHSRNHQSPDNANTSQHSAQHQSTNKQKSTHHHSERHHSPENKDSLHHNSAKPRSLDNKKSSHRHTAKHRSPETDTSGDESTSAKTTGSTDRTHSRHSSKPDRSRHHHSKHHGTKQDRPSDRSILKHQSPKVVGSGHKIATSYSVVTTVSSHVSITRSRSPKTIESTEKTSTEPTKSSHETIVRNYYTKATSKSSHVSFSTHHSRHKIGSSHKTPSKHRSVTSHASPHVHKSTSKQSGKGIPGKAVQVSEPMPHYKRDPSPALITVKTSSHVKIKISQHSTSGHKKKHCHCKTENCKCKSGTCDVRDNKSKQETKTSIAPVHYKIKKEDESVLNVIEPKPDEGHKPQKVRISDHNLILPTWVEKPPPLPERYDTPVRPSSSTEWEESVPPTADIESSTEWEDSPPPKRYESPISPPPSAPRDETPPFPPQRYESPITAPPISVREEQPPTSPRRYESPTRQPPISVRDEPPPPSPRRYESPTRQPPASVREEKPLPSPRRYESPTRLPSASVREEPPPPSPRRYESPTIQPPASVREEPPPPSPRRYESPTRQPPASVREEPPPPSPRRYESPTRQPPASVREEPPPPSPRRYESPTRQPPASVREEPPPPSPRRYESPIKQPLSETRPETPTAPPQIDQSAIRAPPKYARTASPPRTPRRYESTISPPPWPIIEDNEQPIIPQQEQMVYDSPTSVQETWPPVKYEVASPPLQQNPLPPPPPPPPPQRCEATERPTKTHIAEETPKNDPPKSIDIQPKCPQKHDSRKSLTSSPSQTMRRASNYSRRSMSFSRSKMGFRDYIPVWYQRTGSTSSDWIDGAAFYNKQHDPANQTGAFAPHVNVEKMVKEEKKKRGIPNIMPYSNENFHNKKKKKRRNSAQGSVDFERRMSARPSVVEQHVKTYSVNVLEPKRTLGWGYKMDSPDIRHQVSIFKLYPDRFTPFDFQYDISRHINMHPYRTVSSIYAVSSLTSEATSKPSTQNPKLVYNDPCSCSIENCQCKYYPCESRAKKDRRKPKPRELVCPNDSSVSIGPRQCSTTWSNNSTERIGDVGPNNTRRLWSPTRGQSSDTSYVQTCMCENLDCECYYEPCISRRRKRRRKLPPQKPESERVKKYKPRSTRQLDEDKCFVCRVAAIEAVFKVFMRACCVTWVWSDRDFLRFYGRKLGDLPDYSLKPPSMRESAIQRCWRERYESDSSDESSEEFITV